MKNPFLENFRPYIPDSARLRELTPVMIDLGQVIERQCDQWMFWSQALLVDLQRPLI